jgi:4-amino-4-deoxy-L-arabinose transferase-like glycosyltransferase
VRLEQPPSLTSLDGAPSASRVWTSLATESHPPLYSLLLRFWRDIAGDGEAAVRALSACASVLAVLGLYAAVRTQTGAEPALWAAALLAVAAPQIRFAQEARAYALWTALGMAAAWALLRIEQWGPTAVRLLTLGACALALLLTHYFAAASVLAIGAYALLRLRSRTRLATVGTLVAAATVYLLAWGPMLLRQRHAVSGNSEWMVEPAAGHLGRQLLRLAKLPWRLLTEPGGHVTLFALLFLAAFGFAIYRSRRDRSLLFWLLWTLTLPLLVFAADAARHARALDIVRYTIPAAPGVCAIVGLFVANARPAVGRTAAGLLVLAVLACAPAAYPEQREWRDLAQTLEQRVRPGDAIVYTGGRWDGEWATRLYLCITHYAPRLPADVILLSDIHHPVLTSALRPGRSLWILSAQPDLPVSEIVPGARVLQEIVLPNAGHVAQVTADPPAVDAPAATQPLDRTPPR